MLKAAEVVAFPELVLYTTFGEDTELAFELRLYQKTHSTCSSPNNGNFCGYDQFGMKLVTYQRKLALARLEDPGFADLLYEARHRHD